VTFTNSEPEERGPERRLPLGAPVRAWALSEWALLPLRLFIGATFTYAGLEKLANPNFFKKASPISIQSQLLASTHTSPISGLLVHLVGAAKPIGLVIAFGEIAVGLGTLFGLWTRIAAVGGLLISFLLFLTVSFHASPYFTGADIVFLFAWMPFVIAGAGSRLSVDAYLAARVAKKAAQPSPELVAIPFSTVQAICGNYEVGHCRARGGLACDQAVCPVLLGGRGTLINREHLDHVDRRVVVLGATVAAGAAAGVLLLGGAAADIGKMINNAPAPPKSKELSAPVTTTTAPEAATTTTVPSSGEGATTTTAPAPAGSLLGSASEVPENSSANFTIPSNGDPGIVIHTASDEFVAYNAVCPHMGCTVGYSNTQGIMVCPCHGSEFKVSNGDVIVGPAPHGLKKLKVVEGTNGNLYLQ
jgi:thiosulfate dehydrogenase [quinone] large subunit